MTQAPDDLLDGEGASTERLKKAPHAYRTISEVADELNVPQHVLRFWETRFPEVRPLKRGGGRRYYRPEDIEVLRRISALLYVRGYTIKGVQRVLREGEGEHPSPSDARDDASGDLPTVPEETPQAGAQVSGESPREEHPAPALAPDASVSSADSSAEGAGSQPASASGAEFSDQQVHAALERAVAERDHLRAELAAVLEELDAIRALLPL